MSEQSDILDKLYRDIHQVLKTWYTPALEGPLDGLRLAHTMQRPPALVTSEAVSKEIVQEALEKLNRVNPSAHRIIKQRFFEQCTAQEIAYNLDVSVDVVYQRQRSAISQIAQFVWEQEMKLREIHARRIESRLDAPSYTRLFGVSDTINQIRLALETTTEPWFFAFEGMGGIGKTALADALVRALARTNNFYEIAWLNARRRLFRLTGNVKRLDDVVNLTPSEFTDRLVEQLDLNDLKRQPDKAKFLGLRAYLSQNPCLIVVDNLETIQDYQALIPQLRQLAGPSKFLMTTRYSLRGESGVHIVQLKGLSPDQTLALIRYEAELQGLSDLAQASNVDLMNIYDVTGGNPLAIKLIIGQVHTFPLPTILTRLSACKGGATAKMLNFIYADAWKTLNATCKWLLQAMLVTSDAGGQLEQIATASGLDMTKTMASMQTLVQHSLVIVSGNLYERRYRLHSLTQAFVAQQIEEIFPVEDHC